MVLKTRDKLIEVARRLFVHKGMDKTTMNDIAEASEKGRRTIYTYFKNKDEIYDAVIESESEMLLRQLREVVALEVSPVEKLERYLRVRFEFLAEMAPAKDYFTLIISHEARRWHRVRKMAIAKELKLFQEVVDEGVTAGVFDSHQAKRLPALESVMFQAMKVIHVRGTVEEFEFSFHEIKEKIIEFIIHGVARPGIAGATAL